MNNEQCMIIKDFKKMSYLEYFLAVLISSWLYSDMNLGSCGYNMEQHNTVI